MAFTTGPDFLTGILGATNSANIFKENNDTRYGERIGDDGYLRTGPFTTDFLDSDGDGIDDRQQAGAGQPEIGSVPEASPIFEGGNVTPPVGGGGGGGDNPNRPMNNMPQDSYDMNPDGTISFYDASTGKTMPDYEYNDPNASFPQRFFGTAMTAADMVPTSMDFLGSVASSLYDRFIDPADQAIAERLGLTGSYDEQQQTAQDFTQSNIDKKEAIASDLEAKNANMLSQIRGLLENEIYSTGFAGMGPPSLADISNYTVAELENEALGINMNMTNQYNNAIRQAEREREAREAQAEQDRINDAVASGAGVGYGYDPETGNYKGLVTYGGYNPGTGETTPIGEVTTGNYQKQQEEEARKAEEIQRAKDLQEQQNQRDLQKQAEKERQAKAAADKAAADRREQARKEAADKAAADKEREKQKNRDAFNERQKAQEKKEAEKNRRDQRKGPGGGNNQGSSGGCFVEGTPIEMADGTTKEITTIELGEETKGGIVEAKMQFLPQNIYNYKDVLVSGSHWVVEDNQLIAVEDSKHGVLTDRIEPVYTFKTSNNRIWIYGIEFGDFETGSDADWEPHFEAVRQKLNKQLDEKTH